jgi:hypothetical protein
MNHILGTLMDSISLVIKNWQVKILLGGAPSSNHYYMHTYICTYIHTYVHMYVIVNRDGKTVDILNIVFSSQAVKVRSHINKINFFSQRTLPQEKLNPKCRTASRPDIHLPR